MTTLTNKSTKKDIGPRPICPVCNTREKTIGKQRKDGTYSFQSMCTPCKHKHLENKNGVTYTLKVALNAGFNNVNDYNDSIAVRNGFKNHKEYTEYTNLQTALSNGYASYVDYRNSKHPSRQHRKDYCENIDGRLDFVCTSTILMIGQLDVDHIDGNPENNDLSNYQTLCKCCHTYKTITNKDGATPGRKKLGIKH